MVTLETLDEEVAGLAAKYHHGDKPRAFLHWFMKAYFSPLTDEQILKEYMSDAKNDKTIDAWYIDSQSGILYVMQSKYSTHLNYPGKISRADLAWVATVNSYLMSGDARTEAYKTATPKVQIFLDAAHDKLDNTPDLKLRFIHVTNRSINEHVVKEVMAGNELESFGNRTLDVYDDRRILDRYQKYLVGVKGPPIKEYVRIASGKRLDYSTLVGLNDKKIELRATVATILGKELVRLYKDHKGNLFHRNIRGFLRETKPNKDIEDSAKHNPETFWFLNNGVTILGERMIYEEEPQIGKFGFHIEEPQIINGLQTTRALSKVPDNNVQVLATFIDVRELPYDPMRSDLINQIITARNNQNPIDAADLISNDPVQVHLEREFEVYGYFYQRKKGAWEELDMNARRYYRNGKIDKVELGKIRVALVDDPSETRKGKNIFRDHYKKMFPENKPVQSYLFPYELFNYVVEYSRNRKNEVDRYARYHVLRIFHDKLVDALKGEKLEIRRMADKFNSDANFRRVAPQARRCASCIFRLARLHFAKVKKKEKKEKGKGIIAAGDVYKTKDRMKEMLRLYKSSSFKNEREAFERRLVDIAERLGNA
jgi:hypothetical protein